MTRIAKKRRDVKRQQGVKPPKTRKISKLSPPRYLVKKDSLDRRYAIDKRTGQRVSVYKAEKERKGRRIAAKAIRQHIFTKSKKVVSKASRAAKKGWETRKAKAQARSEAAKKGWAKRKRAIPYPPPIPISVLTPPAPPTAFPEGVEMVSLYENLKDRAARFPKVKAAAEYAFARLQFETWERLSNRLEGKPPPPMTREERIKANIRDLIAERMQDSTDLDRHIDRLYDELDGEYSLRELYHLYWSPDVA